MWRFLKTLFTMKNQLDFRLLEEVGGGGGNSHIIPPATIVTDHKTTFHLFLFEKFQE